MATATKKDRRMIDIAKTLRDIAWDAEKAADLAEEIEIDEDPEGIAPYVARRALSLCERCVGIPELSINRCPMCRCMAELVA